MKNATSGNGYISRGTLSCPSKESEISSSENDLNQDMSFELQDNYYNSKKGFHAHGIINKVVINRKSGQKDRYQLKQFKQKPTNQNV